MNHVTQSRLLKFGFLHGTVDIYAESVGTAGSIVLVVRNAFEKSGRKAVLGGRRRNGHAGYGGCRKYCSLCPEERN